MDFRVFSRGWLVPAICGVALLFGACTPPRLGRPAWVVARAHRDVPAEDYLIGVGESDTAEGAAAAARRDLLDRVTEAVHAEFDIRLPKLTINGVAWMRRAAVDELIADPAGLQVPIRWHSADGSRHAALAAIPRQELVQALREQIRSDETQCEQLTADMDDGLAKAPYQTLIQLLAALSVRAQVEEQRTVLAALTGPGQAPPSRGPTLADLLAALRPALDSIRILAAHGHELPVRSDARKVSLVLSADLPAEPPVPLAMLPVVFTLPGPSAAPLRTRVNAAGMAEVEVPTVKPYAGRTVEITARVDGPRLLAEAGLEPADPRFAAIADALSHKRATFALRVLDERAGRVALVIAETRDGEFHENSRLVAGLVRDLTAAGFHPVELDELDVELPANPSPKTMAERFRGKADYVIYGVIQAQVTRTIAAGMSFARARGQLITVRVADAEELDRVAPTSRGPGRDPASAMNRAISAFGRQAQKTILPALQAGPAKSP